MPIVHAVSTAARTNPLDHFAGELGRWMIFSAGLVIIVAALLLPMNEDLRAVRLERDRTLHLEQAQELRIDRYREFLNQLASPDQQTVELLAMTQLGMIPSDRAAIITPGELDDTLLIEAIEPAPEPFNRTLRPQTRLERLISGPTSSRVVILGGLLAVLYGLLPATKPS